MTDTFIYNIEQVFKKCGIGVTFGQTNIMEWLNCSKSKATNIMNAMKAAKVIRKVTGLDPESMSFWKYRDIEDSSNKVYHRAYVIQEPIEVRVEQET